MISNHGVVPSLYSPLKFDAFSLSYQNSCGITEDGKAWCQGLKNLGQIGDGTDTPFVTNGLTQVQSSLRFKSIEPGIGYTCALTTDGKTYCWGGNREYAIGNPIPGVTPVVGGVSFRGAR